MYSLRTRSFHAGLKLFSQMNQSRSTYKSDFVPYDWMQNNFTSNADDFCSSENIDDCLRYISREFSALGYPSIYTNENSCEYAVNCDIVKLLNVTFELLGNCREYAQSKEDLECRNRSLLEDLKVINRKNSQLKDSLEQSDRRYKNALEKERQSKEKNKELTQLLKIEKDECKRLSSQMQQQKKTYQHETRKHENDMSQMKSRLNQIIADKNPDKKIANITSTNLLQRNSNQRGKWKTGSVAKSNLEEMYKSVISSYETRSQEMLKEMGVFKSCLEYIQSQLLDTIALLLVGASEKSLGSSSLPPLNALYCRTNLQKSLEERFTLLLEEIKKAAFPNCNTNKSETEDSSMTSQVTPCRTVPQDCKFSEETDINEKSIQSIEKDENSTELASEKEQLQKQKLELSSTLSLIQKEKADLEIRKLELIKMALHQEVPKAQWHQNLNTVPSFSVIQTNDGLTAVPCANQLRHCLSAPDQQVKSLTPLWKSESSKQIIEQSTSQHASPSNLAARSRAQKETVSEDPCLPKWAIAAMNVQSLYSEPHTSEIETTFSNEDLELSTMSSSEEQNLMLLSSAMEDIEKRRKQVPL